MLYLYLLVCIRLKWFCLFPIFVVALLDNSFFSDFLGQMHHLLSEPVSKKVVPLKLCKMNFLQADGCIQANTFFALKLNAQMALYCLGCRALHNKHLLIFLVSTCKHDLKYK